VNAKLMKRAEEVARAAQRRKIREVADYLSGVLGTAAVNVEEARVIVSGRRLLQRWFGDPRLRFYGAGK
jgi:hypothetical protein